MYIDKSYLAHQTQLAAMELSLHIVVQTPPIGVDYGLQKGSGNDVVVLQVRRTDGSDLDFHVPIVIKGDSSKDDMPKFSGPFSQGPKGGNFIYVNIGGAAGQQDAAFQRRLKVPLAGITWAVIDQLTADPGLSLKTIVPGTAKDGTPTCATVKPFDGWKVVPK